MSATALCIQVTERGENRVRITFDAAATDNLPDLIPPDVLPKLAARNIDAARIAVEARERNYAPAELFVLQEGERTLRVWLE